LNVFSIFRQNEALPPSVHEEYEKLCAFAATGELTQSEQEKLQRHLRLCQPCREVSNQFEQLVDMAFPVLAAEELEEGTKEDDMNWSPELAEAELFSRLQQEKYSGDHEVADPHFRFSFKYPFSTNWENVWMLYAAGILLFVALALFAYRLGSAPVSDLATTTSPAPSVAKEPTAVSPSLEEQLAEAGHDREEARSQIAQRDQLIAQLRRKLSDQAAEISEIKAAEDRLRDDVQAGETGIQALSNERAELAGKLVNAQGASKVLEQKLAEFVQQAARDAEVVRTAEAKVSDLTRQLQDRENEVQVRDELLAHDRDIREVMGARDLYITEVYDVAGTGETKKPYGRVFYTRGKSLVFYAYDLDRQTGLKAASTFQAWGRRGPDRQHAVNLGVFFEDNAANKRWVLKCDDPTALAQIDAVFVTVEPGNGSHAPSSKTLLFASLNIDPNHP
jgi:hypothetical protein